MNRLIDTGTMIKTYLEANDITIADVVNASNVSFKTVYRVLNNESKLSYEVAKGINSLIPEIAIDFLMSYDAKYRVQVKEKEEKLGIKNIKGIIDKFQLKKLYPEIANDENALIEKGMKVFNFDNIEENNVLTSVFNFDLANNSKEFEKMIWIKATYEKYLENNKVLDFNKENFNKMFCNINKYCGTTNLDMTLFNMKKISEQCGINFYYQESIKNSRIRGVTFKKDGKVFLYISDLFKCVERLWVSYIHELIHIMNNDLDKEEFRIEEYRKDNEDFIEDKTISFFINDYRNIKSCNIETVLKVAEENKIQKGIAAYLIRNITNVYDVSEVNELLHYY